MKILATYHKPKDLVICHGAVSSVLWAAGTEQSVYSSFKVTQRVQ